MEGMLLKIHVVESGDTLWKIANKYGVPANVIASANQLMNPDRLVIGQALVIPDVQTIHTVKAGENLWLIASRYGTTAQAIARENSIINPQLIYPGQRLLIPKGAKPSAEVNAYLNLIQSGEFNIISEDEGIRLLNETAPLLTYLGVFSYDIRADGSITSLPDQRLVQRGNALLVEPLMTVSNFESGRFSTELAHAFLNNNTAQTRFFNNLLNLLRQKGYRGVNIDFEYVSPEDGAAYNAFLRKAVSQLHPEGYIVSTAVAPKTSGSQKGLLYEAHDYGAHGAIVDFVVLMTYEWGWAGGPPWAIAPINEVRKVLDYAVTVIPRKKIMLGVPLYGRDWTLPYAPGNPFAELLSPQEAVARAARYGVSISYHPIYQAPYYRYKDERGAMHEVWFEDARSIQAKFNLVKEYGLRGVSYWALGQPFPQNWVLLRDNFNVR